MNYGKNKASKKQKEITSKATMQSKRIGVRLFKAFLLCLLLIVIACIIAGFVFLKKIIDDSPDITAEDVRPSGYTSIAYADDGVTEIERFVTSGSNRVYKSISEISEDVQHAFVAIEDERFYEHNGIDPMGIARAFVRGVANGGHFTEGASTITQQLIKNNIFPNFVSENTFFERAERKIQEQYLALKIEKQMSKDEILESYLNTINLGQNTLGIQSASMRYFNKDASELTLSEAAVIAGITQSPTTLNPIDNPEANQRRRDEVLQKMLDQGYITREEYDSAKADDVYARIQNVNSQITDDTPTTYFTDALSQQIIEDLQDRLGFSETRAYNALYSGGLQIYTTQNLAMQQICDEEMNNDENYPWLVEVGLDYALTVTRADGTVENYSSGHINQYVQNTYGDEQGLLFSSEEEAQAMIAEWKTTIAREGDTYDEVINLTPQPQAAVTIIDQATGQVKAMVGGRGAKTTSLSLNRAYKGSPRQPGSCFKILSTYAPALDTGEATLATIIRDEPWEYSDGTPLKNATNNYMGDITMRTAIKYSQNVCAVKMINEITPQVGYEYAEKFGFTTLEESDKVESLALGGLTKGVYNYELCAAFAAIANKGVYNRPTLYTKILDHDGNVLLEGASDTHTVIKETTAALLTSAMEDVVESGTGSAASLNNMPVAGKTGTTDHDQTLWFCGYTPYYTCAVWGGYDENKSLTNIDTTFRFRLWRSIMSRIHENLEYKEFTMPNSVEKKWVCTETGLLARSGCPSVSEYFSPETVPTEGCDGDHWSYYDYYDDEDEDEESSSGSSGTSGSSGSDNYNDTPSDTWDETPSYEPEEPEEPEDVPSTEDIPSTESGT